MEKKYQVFISSTYKDLIDERSEVIQALLELDCIPVGMESFPAADEDQWSLIKRLIDDCDYYILIVGGRYGSLSPNGKSYTQMEYEYALNASIPIISFLHKNPNSLSVAKIDNDPELQRKLADFKTLAQQKMCRFWESPSDLGSQVSRSIIKLIKDKPRPGWVKATLLPSEDTTKELLRLRTELERLTIELEKASQDAPKGTEDLSQGDELFRMEFSFYGHFASSSSHFLKEHYEASWNDIFSYVSPIFLGVVEEKEFQLKVSEFIESKTAKILVEKYKQYKYLESISITDEDFQTIKIQFRALGLIAESKRSNKSSFLDWTLTPYGDKTMSRLRAKKRR